MGVEPKLEYVQAGIPVAASPEVIEEVYGKEKQFDVVTCIHTLEHTIDFQGLAEHIKRLVKPGGQVIIEVPSAQSPGVLNNSHLYFFNPTVLMKVFEPLQFEHMKFTPHLFMTFRRAKNG
jgi:2-polyprenyl-3-methyl-5-hydroxy-6-metoxy-1,4-benzoquinol methylase